MIRTKILLVSIAIIIAAVPSSAAKSETGAWSKPVNGIQGRLIITEDPKFNVGAVVPGAKITIDEAKRLIQGYPHRPDLHGNGVQVIAPERSKRASHSQDSDAYLVAR